MSLPFHAELSHLFASQPLDCLPVRRPRHPTLLEKKKEEKEKDEKNRKKGCEKASKAGPSSLTPHPCFLFLFSHTHTSLLSPFNSLLFFFGLLRLFRFHQEWHGRTVWLCLLGFVVIKFVLTALAATLPTPAGIFVPIFVLGAGFGRLIGEIMALWFPHGVNGFGAEGGD